MSKQTPEYGIFNDSFPPILDGVTLTVENYVRWLNKKGYPTSVITPWNPSRFDTDYKVMRFFSLPIWSRRPYRYGYPKLDPFIWKKLRNTPFRLVHSHCPFSSGRLAVYVKNKQHIPLIGTFHSKYKDDLKHSFKLFPWAVPIIMKRILDFFNSCDEVWIPQAQVEETVREYGYKGPLEVVENGVDFGFVSDNEIKEFRSAARKEMGIDKDEISLLFVGQHILDKGIMVILEAMNLLKGKIRFKMNYVGNGYALDDLRQQINRYGLSKDVKVNGIVADREILKRFYASADLFLFPSFYDNAPLVLREAAAMNTPGLILHNSTASEVIKDGVNGYLTERTPESYAEKILQLSENRPTIFEVGSNARKSLVKSWENVMEEVMDRYNILIHKTKKAQ